MKSQYHQSSNHANKYSIKYLQENEYSVSINKAKETSPQTLDNSTIFDHISIDDPVQLYFREMSLVPLLKQEEELILAQRIEQAKNAELELIKFNGRRNTIEYRKLRAAIQEGLRAREHLIKANTRLVVSVAKKYNGHGLPFLDLIQEGNLGLMRAIEKYDHHRGFRFSTYATWWIRQAITRAIADFGRTIRVPVHMSARIRQMKKIIHNLEQSLGRKPTIEEVAIKMEQNPKKTMWMQQVSWLPISLESTFGEDEDTELGLILEDKSSPVPSQLIYQNMLREKISEILSTLSYREARIIRLRFGLDNVKPHTLEEIGRKFGLSRERIRQIEVKALCRLRNSKCSLTLKEYL